MAKRLDPMLSNIRSNWGVIIVFFDGEEAFRDWTETDSLYGARHLATEWAKEQAGKKSILSRIHTFTLLDLIGASQPSFQNLYNEVQPAFERLMTIESRLRKSNLCVITHCSSVYISPTILTH